jgi:hypothetical protein
VGDSSGSRCEVVRAGWDYRIGMYKMLTPDGSCSFDESKEKQELH